MLAVLSLSWPFIAGLGALPLLAFARPLFAEPGAETGQSRIHLLAACWCYGLSLDYLLMLLTGSTASALAAGGALALAGIALAVLRRRDFPLPRDRRGWLLALALLVLALVTVVMNPLEDWDGRSIWFFHAKMIFFGGGLRPEVGLASIPVAQPHYPLLLPGLAAQVGTVVGYWNEYLPKFALILLMPVPLLALLSLAETPRTMAVVAVGMLAIPEKYLGNGSMDGFLALYGAAAGLFLADWLEGGGETALLAAAGALGVCLGLKQDGQVVVLAFALSVLLLRAIGKLRLPAVSGRGLALALLPFASYFAWQVILRLWGLRDQGFSLEQGWQRAVDPHEIWRIVHQVVFDPQVAIMLVLAVVASAGVRAQGARLPPAALLAILAGLFCTAGFVAIFAMTESRLIWHLITAATRVVKSGALLILIGSAIALRQQERSLATARLAIPAQEQPETYGERANTTAHLSE